MINIKSNKKGVALILSIFAVTTLFSFISLGTYEHIQDLAQERYYENNLQVLYDLESARTACLWEEAAAGYNWDTTKTSACRLQGATIVNDFYRLGGHNFVAQTHYDNGVISIYAHAYKGQEAAPEYSRYLEYIYSPSPMYQYMMFSNRSLSFGGGPLYHLKGAKIHTNGDLQFSPYNDGVRFDQVSELSASGTIYYAQAWSSYPSPRLVDNLDGSSDGMAPAPYLNTANNLLALHHYTTTGSTTGTLDLPGPYYYGYTNPQTGQAGISWKSAGYGEYVGGDWGTYGRVPRIWRGEESFFYGSQYTGLDGNPYPNNYAYLTKDGAVVNSNMPSNAVIERFYLSGNSLQSSQTTQYHKLDVAFRPYKDKSGEINDKWYELPGALPQDYTWANKYYSKQAADKSVTFYATEACLEGSAGCIVDKGASSSTTKGWRYIKRGPTGNACVNDDCYNNVHSSYLKAQDYIDPKTGKPYYNNLSPMDNDKNKDFFTDSGYRYGNDIQNQESDSWKIRTFNSSKQQQGFQEYLSQLSQKNVEGVVRSGVEKKEPFLGKLFNDDTGDSPYKEKAELNGIYIDNIDNVVNQLNADLPPGEKVAQRAEFYNWKTNKMVTLIDVDIGKMKEHNRAPTNGIIYSKVPLRLSNAADLPGVNTNKTAVFTVISEESVYLKGDYNTGGGNSANWKISNIASKKKVYTLSNAFNDPQKSPDFAVYNEWPYVYTKVVKDEKGRIIQYLKEEGAPAVKNGVWMTGGEFGVPSDVKKWVSQTVTTKQKAYANSGISPINRVDKAAYSYYSLFITPYDYTTGDSTLENWYYLDKAGAQRQAKKNMEGAFINFYNPSDPKYDNEYYSALGAEEGAWNYRRASQYYPSNEYYLNYYGGTGVYNNSPPLISSNYDGRFPQVIPQDFEGVLGFTGRNIWRLTSQNYFENQISQ